MKAESRPESITRRTRMPSHDQTVHAQFDPRSQRYLASSVHAAGLDLAWVENWLQRYDGAATAALDIGSGPGHLSFRLMTRFESVCAVDLSASMLQTLSEEATRRGTARIRTQVARAESLPFADASFDLVATRYSAHHWLDVPRALQEMRRVLRPGGQALVLDLLGDDSPLVDTHLQALELIRDPSHVRDYTTAEWNAHLRAAGFRTRQFVSWPLRLEFQPWVERMAVPTELVTLLRTLGTRAPQEVRAQLKFETDGSFSVRTGLFLAEAD
jgi:ubiquinone/menaquinone biosynthesis C-methylase UbiE